MALYIAPSGSWAGNDGPWSTFYIEVGSPPQRIEVLPATALSLTIMVLAEGCPPDLGTACETARGGVFDAGQDSSWQNAVLTAANGYHYFDIPVSNGNITAEVSLSTMTLDWGGAIAPGAQNPLEGQLFAGYAISQPYLGQLGISGFPVAPIYENASYEPPLYALRNRSNVSSLTWGYTAGANYKSPKAFGSLVFGGYDASLIEMEKALVVPFSEGSAQTTARMRVFVSSISLKNSTTTVTEEVSISTILDSGTSETWLPRQVCAIFEDRFQLQWNESAEMYLIDNALDTALRRTSVSFTLGIDADSETITVELPYAAFDHEVKSPLANITDDTTLRYFPLKRAIDDTQAYLGRTFFQEA